MVHDNTIGYKQAMREVKKILKNQPFLTFNIHDHYSIRPMITTKEIDAFLKEILNWVFQDSGEKTQ